MKSSVAWATRFTKRFNCAVPIIGAPVANHSGGKLAAEVCRAGGLGFIGAGHWLVSGSGRKQLKTQIDLFREIEQKNGGATYPLCLGFIGHSTSRHPDGWEQLEYALDKYRPAVVQFFAPAIFTHNGRHPTTNVALAQSYNAKVLAQVGTVKEALDAAHSGVVGIIAQGSEAGGHGVRRELGNGTLSLAATITSHLQDSNIPVIAAGGIVDGRTMAAALMLGCDAVVLGTRLWASKESIGFQSFKDQLVSAKSCDDVVRTVAFDWIQNTYHDTPWPEPFDSVGALRNITSKHWQGRRSELAAELGRLDSKLADTFRQACELGNADIGLVHAGEGVGLIDAIEPAHNLVERISRDAYNAIQSAPQRMLGG